MLLRVWDDDPKIYVSSKQDQLDQQQRQMATLLAKFRIDYSDVIVIPDITKKADPSTKAEFQELISGCDISQDELDNELEKIWGSVVQINMFQDIVGSQLFFNKREN